MSSPLPSICMLVYSYAPEATGGAERQCRLQAQELARRGYRCLVLTTRQRWTTPRREMDQGCEVIRFPTIEAWRSRFQKVAPKPCLASETAPLSASRSVAPSTLATLAARAVRWLNAAVYLAAVTAELVRRRRGIDLLHTHVAAWNAGYAGWIGHWLRIPVVAKAAFLPVFPPISGVPMARLWTRWRQRIHYVALMESMVHDLTAEGIPRERIRIVPNGVAVPQGRACAELNSMVLHVGNLTQGAAHKGFDVLLEAWARVTAVHPTAHLCNAGGGDPAPWQELAERLGCGQSVRFAGYTNDLSGLYGQASLLVLPSRGEGMSNALLEALSWGLPAVVSDIPGNRALVVDGVNGRVVPAGNPAALAQALLDLRADPEARRRMGAAARERIQESHTVEAVVDRLCDFYADLIGSHAAGRSERPGQEAG